MASSRRGNRRPTARQRQIIGRTGERELFGAALDAGELPFHVHYVFGRGGIGKTTPLGVCAARCAERVIHYTQPDALLAMMPPLLSAAPHEQARQPGTTAPIRCVQAIVSYEELLPLDQWLRVTRSHTSDRPHVLGARRGLLHRRGWQDHARRARLGRRRRPARDWLLPA